MKKWISLLLAVCLLFALAACGVAAAPAAEPEAPQETPAPAEPEVKEWTRQGFFEDENDNMISVTWMDDTVEPGWYVGVMIGDTMTGWTIPQEGDSLHGDLNAWDESAEPFVVTVTEEGEDGLLLVVEGGESYHFKPMDIPTASIFVSVNTEGWGNISYAEGEEAPEIDTEYPYQSAQINLAEPKTHTFVAWPRGGSRFVKWTKNGEDYSTEAQITVLLDESMELVAVFEEDPDWVDPVAAFTGEYQSGRASAWVDSFGDGDMFVTVSWGSSAWETTQWFMTGRFDPDTRTLAYSGGTKTNLVYDDEGGIKSEETEYGDGTGTLVFYEDGRFVWHEDGAERDDMTFERLPEEEGDPDYYSAVTAMDKRAVEEQCAFLRDAYLNEDWETIAVYLSTPITVDGTELKSAEEFLAFMADKTVNGSDREAMEAETCRDMFFNGQGICLGDGELWIVDLSYLTEEAPELAIIGINGIVNK